MNYAYQETTYTVRLEALPDGSYRAMVNGREYLVQATPLSNGGWKLNLNGERHTVYTAAEGRRRYVKVDGDSPHTLTIPDARSPRRRAGGAGGDSLVAQMPGQVVDVAVAEGDTVSAGQTLIVLEAMKMEIRVSAPHDGTVKQVLVKKGDVVEREQLLIEVLPQGE
jgi:biotin carboxyl carrier protein